MTGGGFTAPESRVSSESVVELLFMDYFFAGGDLMIILELAG
jgi:hypothetical protein